MSVHDPWQEQPTISENFTLLEGLMNCISNLPNSDPLLKAEQVAERLSCSKPQVYQLIRRGILPAVRIETMVRVRNSDLESFIDKHLDTSSHKRAGLTNKPQMEGEK